MRSTHTCGVGGVLSADIAVPEHARELRFYAQILTTGKEPLWRDDLMNSRGTPVIGLGERVPEYESLPLQWMPHIQVADVAASAARAVELGGVELMHGKDEDGQSQWAVLVDPGGAAFGVIPVVGEEANVPGNSGTSGSIAWLTLTVSDVSKTCEFYEQVIGWSGAPNDEGGCEMRRPGGDSVAEICIARGDEEVIPPVWILSLPVGDLEESLRRVRDGGGEVLQESLEPRSAVIRDPVRVSIALQGARD